LGAAGLAQFDELKFGKIKECEAFSAPASFIFHRKHPDLVTWTPHKWTGSIKIMKIFIEKNSVLNCLGFDNPFAFHASVI
jgi:hypothetical protein